MALCDGEGHIVATTPTARALLKSAGIDCEGTSCPLPESLWPPLTRTPVGQSIEWRPSQNPERCIGFTRHRYGNDLFALLMRELTDSQLELRRRLQVQRLEAIGRLVAGIAHDLRAPLSSIVFGASVLVDRSDDMPREQIREKLEQISAAARRQQETIARLLDFARLGPPARADLSLQRTFSRVSALLRPTLREGNHQVIVDPDTSADMVHGNPIEIEQILINLILNSIESREQSVTVRLRAALHDPPSLIAVHVEDDGPGIPSELRSRLFDPFFTTKTHGTGLGLVNSREAAVSLGGNLVHVPSESGAHFVLLLPKMASVPPRSEVQA